MLFSVALLLAAYDLCTPQSSGSLRPRGALNDRYDRPRRNRAYFPPYPIFCLKVAMMSFSRPNLVVDLADADDFLFQFRMMLLNIMEEIRLE